jgi:hypothetical protein
MFKMLDDGKLNYITSRQKFDFNHDNTFDTPMEYLNGQFSPIAGLR